MHSYTASSSRKSIAVAMKTFGTTLFGTYPTSNVWCQRIHGNPPMTLLFGILVDNSIRNDGKLYWEIKRFLLERSQKEMLDQY